jgi:hypothetical protein
VHTQPSYSRAKSGPSWVSGDVVGTDGGPFGSGRDAGAFIDDLVLDGIDAFHERVAGGEGLDPVAGLLEAKQADSDTVGVGDGVHRRSGDVME